MTMTALSVLAIDLGAESGRVMTVSFDSRGFAQKEIHRFRNLTIDTPEALYWNALRLWHEMQIGIDKALTEQEIDSIGVSTWGVDFVLLDRAGNLIDNPVHYRDRRTGEMMNWVLERVPARTLYQRTGVALMSINTLFQLASLRAHNSPDLKLADRFLTIPSLFLYWLCGVRVCEFTHTTTTQMFNPRANTWDTETLSALNIPNRILPEIVMPGTRLGYYRGIPVIATASHDTASAVAAVPSISDGFAFISNGTWSLVGIELPEPLINDATFEAGVSNEGGVGGTYRLLHNVLGLWLVQASRQALEKNGVSYEYDELVRLAERAEPFRSLIDVNDPSFVEPGDMQERIRSYCLKTGQPGPDTVGQLVRAIFESLALKYSEILNNLVTLTGREISRIHVIGGGSQNQFLNQLTANATGCPVFAGPIEATALGNAMVQFIELGAIENIHEARRILNETTMTAFYTPEHSEEFELHRERLKNLS